MQENNKENSSEQQTSSQSPAPTPQAAIPQVNETKETPKADQVVLSGEQYSKILERLAAVEDKAKASPGQNEFLNILEKGLRDIAKSNKEDDGYFMRGLPKAFDMDLADEEDVLDEPASFFAYGLATAIVDDVRGNSVVNTPYNRMFKFKNLYIGTVPSTGPQRNKTVSMCTFMTRSKKEAQFVREHSLFGIKFFEDAGKAALANHELADLIAIQFNALASKSSHEIFEIARKTPEVGVHTQDITALRRAIAKHRGKLAFENQQKSVHIEVDLMPSGGQVASPQMVDTTVNRQTVAPQT